jgi:hypothetical protein
MKFQAIVTSVILFMVACQAQAQLPLLKSYRADYVVKYDGFPIGKSTTTLAVNNHRYQLCIFNVTTVPFLRGSVRECSNGNLLSNQIQPILYSYEYKHNQKYNLVKIQFDWQNHVAVIQTEGTQWKTNIPDNTQDKLSYQLALRLALNQQTHFCFPVADGGKIKIYEFDAVAKEQITTPLQQFDTIKLVRSPTVGKDNVAIWFAPALNNIAVRVEQNKHLIDSGTAEIVNYHA